MNIWGYRGAPLGAKQAGETRVAVLGGSTAFGWGLPAHEAIAAMLERRLLADARANRRRISVANLGAPGQGAYAFRFDLEDFAYLDYDIVVLYEGYNDVGLGEVANRGVPNYLLWRRQSPVFRLTGYFPVLPIIVREKSMAMLHGGDLEGAYEGKPVVFRPGLAARATAQTLNAAAKLSDSVAAQLGRLSDAPPTPAVDEQCTPRWKQYCGAVREAVAWALARDKRVVFVTQPYASDSHVEQQANAVKMLDARFAGDRRLQIVNLGHAIDLRDPRIAYDGLHLVAAGNDVIAAHLVDPVFEADAVSGARQ
jgi:lysophospholipase L1-like esterase